MFSQQKLMMIVLEDTEMEIEAWTNNQDIGFVHEGQTAAIKTRQNRSIEFFLEPFWKYKNEGFRER